MKIFTTCDLCKKPIEYGETHHTVNLHKERAHVIRERTTITVDQAETLLTTCISCGRNLHQAAIQKVLSSDTPEKARMLGELFIPMEVN